MKCDGLYMNIVQVALDSLPSFGQCLYGNKKFQKGASLRDRLKPRSNQRFLKLCNSRVCYSKLQDTCDFPTPQMYSKQAHSAVMSSPLQMNLINQETLVFCQQSRFSFSPSLISCHLLALALWDGITIRLSSVGVSVRHLCQ